MPDKLEQFNPRTQPAAQRPTPANKAQAKANEQARRNKARKAKRAQLQHTRRKHGRS